MNNVEKKLAAGKGGLTCCPLWCWGHIGLIMCSAGCMRELVDGLPELAV